MFIVLIGPPGAGKGTQCTQLVDYLQIPHFSTGDMLRAARVRGTEVGRLAGSYMDAGQLVPDNVVTAAVTERLSKDDCKNGCLLDGIPRTLPQAESLEGDLARFDHQLAVLEIQVPEEQLFQRLASRERTDDTPALIRDRLSGYAKLTRPLVDYYGEKNLLATVDGLGTPDEVFQRIKAAVDAARSNYNES